MDNILGPKSLDGYATRCIPDLWGSEELWRLDLMYEDGGEWHKATGVRNHSLTLSNIEIANLPPVKALLDAAQALSRDAEAANDGEPYLCIDPQALAELDTAIQVLSNGR